MVYGPFGILHTKFYTIAGIRHADHSGVKPKAKPPQNYSGAPIKMKHIFAEQKYMKHA